MNKLKRGDLVEITVGRFKKHQGQIIAIKDQIVHVDGVNLKKAVKPNPNKNEQGGIKAIPANINISNVVLILDGKRAKVGIKTQEDGRRVRFDKRTDAVIDQ